MAVVHAADKLLEEVAGLILTEAPCLDDAIKQLATRGILHHDAQVGGRKEHLVGWPPRAVGSGRAGGWVSSSWIKVQAGPAHTQHKGVRSNLCMCVLLQGMNMSRQ